MNARFSTRPATQILCIHEHAGLADLSCNGWGISFCDYLSPCTKWHYLLHTALIFVSGLQVVSVITPNFITNKELMLFELKGFSINSSFQQKKSIASKQKSLVSTDVTVFDDFSHKPPMALEKFLLAFVLVSLFLFETQAIQISIRPNFRWKSTASGQWNEIANWEEFISGNWSAATRVPGIIAPKSRLTCDDVIVADASETILITQGILCFKSFYGYGETLLRILESKVTVRGILTTSGAINLESSTVNGLMYIIKQLHLFTLSFF